MLVLLRVSFELRRLYVGRHKVQWLSRYCNYELTGVYESWLESRQRQEVLPFAPHIFHTWLPSFFSKFLNIIAFHSSYDVFFSAFAKSRKSTISFIMPFRLSIRSRGKTTLLLDVLVFPLNLYLLFFSETLTNKFNIK
jgi:hypothetical protein